MCSSYFGILVFSNMVSKHVRRLAHVVDRDREAEFPHLHFLSFSYISGLRGMFHCTQSTRFIQEHFLFHSKRFLFAQDTTISVKFEGIKPKYTFKKICRVLFWFYIICFRVATLLDMRMLFPRALFDLRKSETDRKMCIFWVS
jgi:hypothetical protein